MTTDKLAAGGDVDEQPICALHRIFFTKRGEDCALCGTARRAGEGSQAAPPDALEKIKALRAWMVAQADVYKKSGAFTAAALCMAKRDTLDSVIDILKASAAAAGSGTFAADFINDVKLLNEFTEHETKCGELLLPAPCACGLEEIRQRIYKVMEVWHAQEKRSVGTFAEGIEAAAKIVDTGLVKWRAKEPVTFQGIAEEIRKLAQEKREPAPAPRDFEDIKR